MQVWKVNVKKEVVASTTTDFIYTGDRYTKTILNAYDATTGKKVWGFIPNAAANTDSDNAPYVSDGIVYISGNDKNMYAVDAKTGTKIWQYPVNTNNTYPVSVNGVLYGVSYDDGKVYALDAKTGTKKWSIVLAEYSLSNPVVINNILYTSVGTSGTSGIVYALDAATGQIKWKQASNVSGSDVCVSNDLVFVVNGDFGITALDANTGVLKWKVGDDKNSPDRNKQTTLNGILYTTTYSSLSIVAMDAKTGVRKWITKNTSKNYTQGSPIGVDGLIYTVDAGGTCYALDADTGTIKWSVADFALFDVGPIVANNLVYSAKGAIDAKTGASKLTFPSGISGSRLALWINGKAYHSSMSGEVQ